MEPAQSTRTPQPTPRHDSKLLSLARHVFPSKLLSVIEGSNSAQVQPEHGESRHAGVERSLHAQPRRKGCYGGCQTCSF